MDPAVAAASTSAAVFQDGLGERRLIVEPTGNGTLEMLCLSGELTSIPSFEFALRERVSRLSSFRHTSYGRVRSVDRLSDSGSTLALVSEHTPGVRLSDILALAEREKIPLDINAALCLIRQLVPAVALMHEHAREIAHGAIGPERLVVTPHAHLVIVEYVMGAALEQLRFSHARYWKELRIALPRSAGLPHFDHRADVTQLGIVALSLILGRQLHEDEYPGKVRELLASAWAISARGDLEPLTPGLRSWLARALQLDLRDAFSSAIEALAALDEVLSGDSEYIAAPAELETFLERYHASADVPVEETPARTPPRVVSAPAAPVHLSEVRHVEARPVEARPVPVEATPARPPSVKVAHPPSQPIPRDPPGAFAAATPIYQPPTYQTPIYQPPAYQPPPRVEFPPPAPIKTVVEAKPLPVPPQTVRKDPTSLFDLKTPSQAPPFVESPSQAPIKTEAPQDFGSALREARPLPPFQPMRKELELTLPYASDESAREPEPDSEPQAEAESPRRWPRFAAAAVLLIALVGGGVFAARRFATSAPAGVGADAGAGAGIGSLTVNTTPTGAQVVVDGEPRGVTPLDLALKAGSHVIVLRGTGDPRTIPVTIVAGTQSSQYIELAKGGSASGQLQIRTEPAGAKVTVDSLSRGISPIVISDLTPGEHTVVLESDFGSVKQSVTIEAGNTASLVVPLTAAASAPLSGWVSVSSPVAVQLFENGRLLGSNQTDRVMVSAGSHQIEVVNEVLGYRVIHSVQVPPGKVAAITIKLPNGTIALNAIPWAEVWIDGEKIGDTPIGNLSVAVGPHEIIFRHPELGEQRQAVTVTLATPARVSIDLRKK
jgi:serine/threonine protein kinase